VVTYAQSTMLSSNKYTQALKGRKHNWQEKETNWNKSSRYNTTCFIPLKVLASLPSILPLSLTPLKAK